MLACILLALTAYTYSYHDWLNLPAWTEVVSITADNYAGYVAVPRGVYQINKTDRRLVRTFTASDGIRGTVRAIAWDQQSSMLWILSTANLLSINPFSNLSFAYDLPEPGINSLGMSRNYVYLAEGDNYHRLDKASGRIEKVNPVSRGVTWYGEKSPQQPADYPFLVPYLLFDRQQRQHPMTSVFPDGRKLWVGTENYGVFLYNLTTKLPIAHWRFGPAGNQIREILKLNDGIWFAGDEQMTRYDVQRDSWSYFDTPFNAFFLDSALLLRPKILDLGHREQILALAGDSSLFWLGTEDGIYSYQPKANVLTRLLRLKAPANRILLERDSVFFGTDDGLIVYDRHTKAWKLLSDTMLQMHFGVFGIAATETRRYYAVHGGLETQDSAGGWELLTPPGFDRSQHLNSLVGFGSKLFAATSQGVIVYDERTGGYTALTAGSGLLSNRVNNLYADENYLWVATDAGICRFDYHALFP
jgi:hypothetical protein